MKTEQTILFIGLIFCGLLAVSLSDFFNIPILKMIYTIFLIYGIITSLIAYGISSYKEKV